jgi:hypothetical protein
MKKQALRAITALSFIFALTAVSASAQTERKRGINIPFSFTVGTKTLPAGRYRVEPHRGDSDRVWLVQSTDGRASALVMTMSAQARTTPEDTKLVFHRYGDQYFLSQIWTPGGNTGRELLMPHLERELANRADKGQTVVLAGGGN